LNNSVLILYGSTEFSGVLSAADMVVSVFRIYFLPFGRWI